MRRLLPVLIASFSLSACGGEEAPLISTPIDTPTVVFKPFIPEVDTGHPYDTDVPDTDVPDTDVPDTDVPDTDT
jgi:hypothetical protein